MTIEVILLFLLLISLIIWLDLTTSGASYVPGRQLTRRDFIWLGWAPTHRHYKGGQYEEATRAIATDPIEAGETVVIYVHSTGTVHARPARLFDEPTRFQAMEEGK